MNSRIIEYGNNKMPSNVRLSACNVRANMIDYAAQLRTQVCIKLYRVLDKCISGTQSWESRGISSRFILLKIWVEVCVPPPIFYVIFGQNTVLYCMYPKSYFMLYNMQHIQYSMQHMLILGNAHTTFFRVNLAPDVWCETAAHRHFN